MVHYKRKSSPLPPLQDRFPYFWSFAAHLTWQQFTELNRWLDGLVIEPDDSRLEHILRTSQMVVHVGHAPHRSRTSDSYHITVFGGNFNGSPSEYLAKAAHDFQAARTEDQEQAVQRRVESGGGLPLWAVGAYIGIYRQASPNHAFISHGPFLTRLLESIGMPGRFQSLSREEKHVLLAGFKSMYEYRDWLFRPPYRLGPAKR